MERPAFSSLITYEEFQQYYWYRKELEEICSSLGLPHYGTKQDLNDILEVYFKGVAIAPKRSKAMPKKKRLSYL